VRDDTDSVCPADPYERPERSEDQMGLADSNPSKRLFDFEQSYVIASHVSDDGRLLVCRGQGTSESLRYIIANEDDVTAQSVVLTVEEVRWLAELWRPA